MRNAATCLDSWRHAVRRVGRRPCCGERLGVTVRVGDRPGMKERVRALGLRLTAIEWREAADRLKKEVGSRLKEEVADRLDSAKPESRATGICLFCVAAATGLLFLTAYLDRRDVLTPFASHPLDEAAYDFLLASQIVGLGIIVGVYFTTAATLFVRDLKLLGRLVPSLWSVFPTTLMIYSVELLAAAAFTSKRYHGSFLILALLDVSSLLAYARLFGVLREAAERLPKDGQGATKDERRQ